MRTASGLWRRSCGENEAELVGISINHRPTILFVADAVTLAHWARAATLARGLDAEKFRVMLASDPRYDVFLEKPTFPVHPIRSLPSEQFLRAAARGRPLYDTQTLRDYVRDDLTLLKAVQPAAVVGDHRLSLSISARVAGVPYLSVINAYWSPYADSPASALPELPINRWLGTKLARSVFRLAWPLSSAYHSLPLNRVRRTYGLPSLAWDWPRVYTDADRTLYADAMELVPTNRLPATHSYLGPILWSPPVELPSWWNDLPKARPLIYVTLGSSGRSEHLQVVLAALAELPVTVIAGTAAKLKMGAPPDNVRLLAYTPGEKLAARADLVICNGGSLTVYQALAAGKPLIGIASNMDQHLSMRYVEKAGVGVLLRGEELNSANVRETAKRILTDEHTRGRARDFARVIAAYAPAQRLGEVLEEVTRHAAR